MSNRTKIITAAAQREYELFLLYGKPAGFTDRQKKASAERKQAYEHGSQNEAVRDFIRRTGPESAPVVYAKKERTKKFGELVKKTANRTTPNEATSNRRSPTEQ